MAHPRLLTLAFLNRCTARIAEAYHYWDRVRGPCPMPSKNDIDPLDIPQLLPGIVLVDVLPSEPWLRYRLVGTHQVAMRGHDPTGQPVRGNYIGHHLGRADYEDAVLENYRLVIERRSFVYDYCYISREGLVMPTHWLGQAIREMGTLLLPLSSDGETVDMVMAYSDYSARLDFDAP